MLFDDRIAEKYRQAAKKKSGAFNLNEYSKKLESIINYCLKK
jgi:hypothetical protein